MKRHCLIALFALAPLAPATALAPVPDFKLGSYFATWYEIASMRGFLQSRCARDTRTEYSAGENGSIMLETRCLRADGLPERSEARARLLDRTLASVLKITSVHFLGIWWYPLGRESILVARGPDNRWLTVGHPSLRYARILAREPALSDADLASAATAMAEAQFDLCAVVLTVQTAGRQQPARLCDLVRAPATAPGPAALRQ
ncbi:MAG: lipocalin family protein [Casimicrobiaceae bacterium]